MTAPTEFADFLTGDDNTNVIFGLHGADLIFGLGGDDLLGGDEGDDILVGGRGSDVLNGGLGKDTANYNDASFAVSANLTTGHAILTANGVVEDDTLISIDNLTGGGSGDSLIGNKSANVLSGMGGNDSFSGDDGADHIYGGDGDDYIRGGAGADSIDGGADVDQVSYYGSTAGVFVNLLTGTATGGDATGDLLANIESLQGTASADRLTGNGLSNFLGGNGGNDTLNGGAGHDQLDGGAGADHINGGSDSDTLYYFTNAPAVQVDLQLHTASGGDAEGDVITGIENIVGTDGGDKLFGDGNDNFFHGGKGNDVLGGRAGVDTFYGEDGNDILAGGIGGDLLIGGHGRDNLTGGSDADAFWFYEGDTGATAGTRDVITDFTSGSDHIDIGSIDANSLLGGDQQFSFVGTGTFTSVAGQLHETFGAGITILEGDTDGNSVADFQIELTGHIVFGIGDIFV